MARPSLLHFPEPVYEKNAALYRIMANPKRLHILNLLAQKEMSGWDTHVASGASVYPSLSNISTPPACVADLVALGHTGMKSGAGFAAWTPEQVAEFKRKYELRLRAAFEVLGVAPD